MGIAVEMLVKMAFSWINRWQLFGPYENGAGLKDWKPIGNSGRS